jgi:hypothetical protein
VAHCIDHRWARGWALLAQAGAVVLIGLAVAPEARCEDDASPIVLTNEDIDRIRAKAKAGKQPAVGLILSGASSEVAEAAPQPIQAAPAAPSPASAPQAGSWQEEYYRLKAVALRQAIERGESIDFTDGMPGAVSTSSSPKESAAAAFTLPTMGPSCMYGPDGRLLHQPTGLRCPDSRRAPQSDRVPSKHNSCIYDRTGDVIHTPAGRPCDRR